MSNTPQGVQPVDLTFRGADFVGVTPKGSFAQPEDGYYPAEVFFVGRGPNDAATSVRVYLKVKPSDFEVFNFHDLYNDNQGHAIQGLKDTAVLARKGEWRSLLESIGYTAEQIEAAAAIGTNWVIGRTCYVGFTQSRGKGTYGQIEEYVTKADFDKYVAEGKKPVRSERGNNKTTTAGAGAPPPVGGGHNAPPPVAGPPPVASPPTVAGPPPVNGGGVPMAAPPPPVAR